MKARAISPPKYVARFEFTPRQKIALELKIEAGTPIVRLTSFPFTTTVSDVLGINLISINDQVFNGVVSVLAMVDALIPSGEMFT